MEQGTDQEHKQKHRVALMRKSSEMDNKLFISHISQKKKKHIMVAWTLRNITGRSVKK